MLRKSSKWELHFVHYIAKFTIYWFIISRFECSTLTHTRNFRECATTHGILVLIGNGNESQTNLSLLLLPTALLSLKYVLLVLTSSSSKISME